MVEMKRRLKHRFGQVVALGVLLFTLAFIPEGYQMWRAEPEIITAGISPVAYDIVFVFGVGIPLLVGLYLTRNVYRWSEEQRP